MYCLISNASPTFFDLHWIIFKQKQLMNTKEGVKPYIICQSITKSPVTKQLKWSKVCILVIFGTVCTCYILGVPLLYIKNNVKR
jgi:hypothetical protein